MPYARVVKGVPPGSTLYLASGAGPSSFALTCESYRCLAKRDVFDEAVRAAHADVFSHVTSAAFVDMLLARHGEQFYGNIFSSLSRVVGQLRVAEGKSPVEFYNPPCEHLDSGDCDEASEDRPERRRRRLF